MRPVPPDPEAPVEELDPTDEITGSLDPGADLPTEEDEPDRMTGAVGWFPAWIVLLALILLVAAFLLGAA